MHEQSDDVWIEGSLAPGYSCHYAASIRIIDYDPRASVRVVGSSIESTIPSSHSQQDKRFYNS